MFGKVQVAVVLGVLFAPVDGMASSAKYVGRGSVVPGTPEVSKYVLPNGLRVLLLRDMRNPVATIRVRLNAGSNREVPGQTGLAHFFEHMMFRKTKFTEEGHYDKALAGIGGRGNAGTSSDYVVFYSQFPAPAIETMMEIESQRMIGVELKDPYFSVEKGAVISERGIHFDNVPSARGGEFLRAVTESGTSMAWPVIGSKADVAGMKIEEVQKFYNNFYTPDNAIVSVGGPLEEKEMLALVEKYFGRWTGKVASWLPVYPPNYVSRYAGKKIICSEDVSEQSYSVVYPSTKASLTDQWYAMALQDALDDNPEGTFERRLQKKRLATGFGFYKAWWQSVNPHSVAMFTLSADQKLAGALEAWEKEVSLVLKKPVTAKFRERLAKQVEVANASAAERMTSLLETHENNEFYQRDFLSTRGMEVFFRNMKEQSFREWVLKNVERVPYFVSGVVPRGSAAECSKVKPESISAGK